MSDNATEPLVSAQVQEKTEQRDHGSATPAQETGTKRPRSNSLEAAAAQALTQLDGPPHLRQQSMGGFQPTLGPPQPMHPSQYANAFSAGQNPGQQQQQQQQQQQPQPDAGFGTPQMGQSPAFRPNTGSPIASNNGQPMGSPAGGRAPGAHQARQRTAVACRYCRKRKIRCTGISHDCNDPRCSNCRRLDQECIYAPVGAPQGNYTRGPMPDAYGRGQAFHPLPQQNMMQGPPQHWQGQPMGYPPQGPYMQYPQGRGVPGPDGQHQFPHGQGYVPGPGYPPQGQQHYQYDNSYPTYVNDPNAAQGQGQFGRLKPETFAVFPSPTAHQNANSVIDPAVQQDIVPEVPEPIPEPTDVAPEEAAVEQEAPIKQAIEGVGAEQESVAQDDVVASELQQDEPELPTTDATVNGAGAEEATEKITESELPIELSADQKSAAMEEDRTIDDQAQNGADEGTNQIPSVDDTQLSKLLNPSAAQ